MLSPLPSPPLGHSMRVMRRRDGWKAATREEKCSGGHARPEGYQGQQEGPPVQFHTHSLSTEYGLGAEDGACKSQQALVQPSLSSLPPHSGHAEWEQTDHSGEASSLPQGLFLLPPGEGTLTLDLKIRNSGFLLPLSLTMPLWASHLILRSI